MMGSREHVQSTDEEITAKRRKSQSDVEASAAQQLPTVPSVQRIGATPHTFTANQVMQLQRIHGNHAVAGILAQQRTNAQTRPVSNAVVQLARPNKGKSTTPWKSRKERRREEEEAELKAMNTENEAWEDQHESEEADPTLNPFAVLASMPENTPAAEDVKPSAPAKPTIDDLVKARDDPQAIRTVLTGHFEETSIGPMSRAWRSSTSRTGTRGFKDIQALAAKAGAKMIALAESEMSDESSPSMGSRSLNSTGTVSGLKKGKGQGWLAGEGATWHVHYDHVKFGNDKKTRINFPKRNKGDILRDLDAVSATYGVKTNLAVCRAWIVNNL